jgi:hypothetical protein
MSADKAADLMNSELYHIPMIRQQQSRLLVDHGMLADFQQYARKKFDPSGPAKETYRPNQFVMTSLVGKVMGSVAALHNENSLALANLNLDFTLVKLEAPQEFKLLALAMSKKKKADAEDGALHRTARKLGALFEGSLPPTQALFRAYGKRVSEISSIPVVNPKSSDRNNIFAGQIGLDTASIWAAATSGAGAIAVHLLACMLSRIFTSSEATSVWAEIVEKHKEHILKERDQDLYSERHDSLVVAAKQEISRTDLANWDASARAWLQSADQAKERQHKQMILILNNASIPINSEPNTYKSVMKAWTTALKAMESLIKGMPQQVQDGAALLGISSWHMYPDILLFGDTTVDVKQKDPIFDDTAVLTLGLEVAGHFDRSVSWSLPLARLQYYGDPVRTSRTAGSDNSKITPDQFSWVVLGCLFETWLGFARTPEICLSWLDKIMTFVREPLGAAMSICRAQSRGGSKHGMMWLEHLDAAAQKLAACDHLDRQLAWQLLSLGRRKSTFLYSTNQHSVPLFGLSHLSNLIPILQTDEIRLELLQKVASRRKLSRASFIIRYQPSDSPLAFEYATARRIKWSSSLPEGEISTSMKHVRWLPVGAKELEELCERPDTTFRGTSPFWRRHDHLTNEGNLCFPVLEDVTVSTILPRAEFGYLINVDFLTTAQNLLLLSSRNQISPGFQPVLITGAAEAAIFQIAPRNSNNHVSVGQLEPQDMEGLFTQEKMDVTKVIGYLVGSGGGHVEMWPLNAYAAVSNIFSLLSHATISTLVLSQNICEGKWVQATTWHQPIPKLARPEAFACISMFETGTCNLDPTSVRDVFAISSGNSLFVADALLVDPYEEPDISDIRRMVGNIGRAGLSLLVPPPRTKIRHTDLGNWKEINHAPFDGTPEDSFQNNSIHLTFTEYEMPLQTVEGDGHTIDRPVNLLESLVSVYDRGKWVSDLDILKALSPRGYNQSLLYRQLCNPSEMTETKLEMCNHRPRTTFLEASKSFPVLRSTSIDNWEELLDPPKSGTIVIRAHGNWLARLALTVVCVNSGMDTIVLGNEPCWSCCGKLMYSMDPSKTNFPTQTGPPVGLQFWNSQGRDSDSDENDDEEDSSDVTNNMGRGEVSHEEMGHDDVEQPRDCSDDSSVEGSRSDSGEKEQADYSGRMIVLVY